MHYFHDLALYHSQLGFQQYITTDNAVLAISLSASDFLMFTVHWYSSNTLYQATSPKPQQNQCQPLFFLPKE